ncbi:MlaD family protein [Flaviaesturariibacter terrae]
MTARKYDTVKLGAFVLAGLAFLILMLYMIGKKKNLFGHTFLLKAHFPDASGLTAGNNVRYLGIDAGTVKQVIVLNDSTVEVTMLVKTSLQRYIRENCVASIGTDGLMGNKLLNLQPAQPAGAPVHPGYILHGRGSADADAILSVLSATVADVSASAKAIRLTTARINESNGLWKLLGDESLPAGLRHSVERVDAAAGHLQGLMADLHAVSGGLRAGRGSLGALLTDTSFAAGLQAAEEKLQLLMIRADTLLGETQALAATVHQQVRSGKGTVPVLLNDKALADNLAKTLVNLEKGTSAFEQSMIALQHNFLLRGYFRKQEARRQKEKAAAARDSSTAATNF